MTGSDASLACSSPGGLPQNAPLSLIGYAAASWAGTVVENPLQEAVKTAAGNYHWQYVDGIRQAFQGHGVCQLFSSWINATWASISTQGDVYGTWHANRTGQMIVASIVQRALGSSAVAPPMPEVAFQANTSDLWTVGPGGSGDTHLGMMSRTSPDL